MACAADKRARKAEAEAAALRARVTAGEAEGRKRDAAIASAARPARIAKGDRGPAGKPGRDGKNGKRGVPGPAGKDGADGKPGPKGDKGDKGAAGRAGRPGRDGKTGPKGERGVRGPKGADGAPGVGWTPVLAVVEDGDRRIHQIAKYIGGTGTKPKGVGLYVGPNGFVKAKSKAVDIRGEEGKQGRPGIGTRGPRGFPGEGGSGGGSGGGEPGNDGWSPVFGIAESGAARVLRLVDWVGGEGTKPATGDYVGASGLTSNIAEAVDIRGPAGANGTNGTNGTNGADGVSQGFRYRYDATRTDVPESGLPPIMGGIAAGDFWFDEGPDGLMYATELYISSSDLDFSSEGYMAAVFDQIIGDGTPIAFKSADGGFMMFLVSGYTPDVDFYTLQVAFVSENGTHTDDEEFFLTFFGTEGPAGPAGTNGEPGEQGAPGADGATWRVGSGVPSNTIGVDGDMYLRSTTGDVYQKQSGVYVLTANIKGPQGEQGEQGESGTGGGEEATDIHLLMALADADALNVIQQFEAGFFADHFDALTYVDVAGATNLDTSTAGQLKNTASAGSTINVSSGAGVTLIGNMTTNGGLAAIRDGNNNQNGTASARGTGTALYCGYTLASDTLIGGASYYGSNAQGMVTGSDPSAVFDLYGKTGSAPANATDGTLIGSLTFTDSATNAERVVTVDVANQGPWRHVWAHPRRADNASATCDCAELVIRSPSSINNVTVASETFTLPASPDQVRAALAVIETNALTENTDLLFDMRRDTGGSWVGTTLERLFTGVDGVTRFGANCDLSAQATAAEIEWRIRSANAKNLAVHGVAFRVNEYDSGPINDGVGTATLTGDNEIGATLTVVFNDDDPDGAATGVTYQWLRDGVDISGETGTTYEAASDDEFTEISVRVNYTDGDGFAESITSNGLFIGVVPGSTTFDSGSGNFTVPGYNTLTVELWGGGGSGRGSTNQVANGASGGVGGNNGVDSTVSTLGLTAERGRGASGGTGTGTGGAGGAGVGGDDNQSGESGQSGTSNSNSSIAYRYGGASPNGGARATGNLSGTTSGADGIAGNAPGGGGTGWAINVNQGPGFGWQSYAHASGGGGGYTSKTYVRGEPGAPDIGDLLAYAVGAGGASVGSGSSESGAGAAGRVKFTWS
jgi:hypothetical protein